MGRILIVEDDPDIARLIRHHLVQAGFEVLSVKEAHEAFPVFEIEWPDLIILDLMLPDPDMDGLDLLRHIRSKSRFEGLGILIVSARGEETDRIIGLEMGADDYLTKPFSVRELIARVKAVLRRYTSIEAEIFQYDGLKIDHRARQVQVGGKIVKLTPSEYELLHFFASVPDRMFTRQQLLNNVWGYSVTLRTVDTTIQKIRAKIGPKWIKTQNRVGYRFDSEPGRGTG